MTYILALCLKLNLETTLLQQFVLAKYMQWCLSSKIPYNEEDTITQINELIDMTKAVNGGLNGRRKDY